MNSYEKSSLKVCIFCAETVKIMRLFWIYFFYVEDCVAASGNISMFFKERATASEKILNDCFWNLLKEKMCDCFWKKICSCFYLELCPLKKIFWSERQIEIKNNGNIFFTSETHCLYVLLVKLLWWKSSYWKNSRCCEKHISPFYLASEIINADNLHLFLLSDGTRIDDNEYLSSLENGTELIVCTEEQIQKLLIYFELKTYLSLKNI